MEGNLHSGDKKKASLERRSDGLSNVMYTPDIEVQITFLSPEEGGRRTAAQTGYRPQFYYDGEDWDSIHTYPNNELVHPSQSVRAFLTFLSPEYHVGKLWPGKTFQCREGQRVVANGVVLKIVELERSAARPHQPPDSPEGIR
jgi:translation elongation factor EF-Tu-like GTPase